MKINEQITSDRLMTAMEHSSNPLFCVDCGTNNTGNDHSQRKECFMHSLYSADELMRMVI